MVSGILGFRLPLVQKVRAPQIAATRSVLVVQKPLRGRAGDAKLVRTNALGKNPDAKPKTELFDLSKDRAESLDLSAGSTAQVEDFARRLDRWQKDVESGPKTEATRTLAR
jgi:hypothetical protein